MIKNKKMISEENRLILDFLGYNFTYKVTVNNVFQTYLYFSKIPLEFEYVDNEIYENCITIREFINQKQYQSIVDNVLMIETNGYSFEPYSNSIRYETSWDWLMKVVEKIENTTIDKENDYTWEDLDGEVWQNFVNFSVMIEDNHCYIDVNYELDPPRLINEISIKEKYTTKIKAVYEAVIEFIKYYNQYVKK